MVTGLPTLRQFIIKAVEQGCKEGFAKGQLFSAQGPSRSHYLADRSGMIAILPKIRDSDPLTPSMVSQLVRALKVDGFDHCIIPETDTDDNGQE
jgi:hypothetical protein